MEKTLNRKTYKNKIISWLYEWVVLTYEIMENGNEKLLFATTWKSDTKILRKIQKNYFDNIPCGKTIMNDWYNAEWKML